MKKTNDAHGAVSRFTDWLLKQPQWRAEFERTQQAHVEMVHTVAGDEAEDLLSALPQEMQVQIIGASLEDLCTQRHPGFAIGNAVDDYDKRRGWRETPPARRYLAALRDSAMSLYEVQQCRPGHSLVVRDLIRGGEAITVQERLGSQQLPQWSRFCARVVFHLDRHLFTGTLFPFDMTTSEALRQSISATVGAMLISGEAATKTTALQRCAALFTNTWLTLVLAKMRNRPQLVNHDGDPLQQTRTRFALHCIAAEIAHLLDACPQLTRHNDAQIWTWDGPSKQRIVHLDTVLLARFSLSETQLLMETNSLPRAERGRQLLAELLGSRLATGQTELTPIEENDFVEQPPKSLTRIEQQALTQLLDRHYRAWPDDALPALDGLTPRAAVQRTEYRDRVVLLLKEMCVTEARRVAGDGSTPYDFSWMWQELGVSD